MPQPLVSIVIPCYNAVAWLEETVDSALQQTYSKLEVVVVDDGSTDDSVRILESYGERIVWETGPNRGGCEARNRGLEISSGERIQFLDADDLLLPNCVADKLAFCDSLTPSEVPCCALEKVENGANFEFPPWWIQDAWDMEYLLSVGSPQTAAPLHTRESLLQVGGFRAGLPCAQEYDLHLRLAIAHDIQFKSHRKPGVAIRPTEGSVSRSGSSTKMHLAFADVLANAARLMSELGKGTQKRKNILAGTLIRVSRKLYRCGAIEDAMRYKNLARSLSSHCYKSGYRSPIMAGLANTIGFSATERLVNFLRR